MFDDESETERRQILLEVRGGCWCRLAREFWDNQATAYAESHLVEVRVQAGGWQTLHRCDLTGVEWVMDRPLSAEHGGGPLRLRRV